MSAPRSGELYKEKHPVRNAFFGLLHRKRYERIFEKSACDKAFSSFFINPYCLTCGGCDAISFFGCEPKKISGNSNIN